MMDKEKKPRWKRARFYLDPAVALAGIFLVFHAGKAAKPWKEWQWERWVEMGPKPAGRATPAKGA